MADPVTTLSLCSGVGWLDEAVGAGCRYFGWDHRVACYCEWESYAASVLLARMAEASLEPAPIYCGDLGQFDGAAFREAVDGIVAGFPCQPWSTAGKQLGTDDYRWLWPVIVRIVRMVGPGFLFLENVSALIAGGGLEHVLSDLAKMGFDAEWCCLTAEAVGAAHRRERVFILAYRQGERWRDIQRHSESGTSRHDQRIDGGCEAMADTERPVAWPGIRQERPSGERRNRPAIDGDDVGDSRESAGTRDARAVPATKAKRRRKRVVDGNLPVGPEPSSAAVGDAASESAQGRRGGNADQRIPRSAGGSLFAPGPGADWSGIPEALWPATERGFRVLVDGRAVVLDASRADQLRCSGNGVVALCGAVAFVELVRRAGLATRIERRQTVKR